MIHGMILSLCFTSRTFISSTAWMQQQQQQQQE
jgi:hypothetical protein